jgi:regulator of sirC expression with transglutaminase-like and TPR domain
MSKKNKFNRKIIQNEGGVMMDEKAKPHPATYQNKGFITENRQILLVAFLLIILVLITYRKAFNNDFVDWDDYTYVVDNNLVRDTQGTTIKDVLSQPVSLNYHPLTILSLRLNNNTCTDCQNGISAAPFIRWNIIIHTLNTLLVFIFIFLLTKRKIPVAFIVAALFGVHPMHVESVVWVSERKDVLYSFFFLSGLIAYIKYLDSGKKTRKSYLWLGGTFIMFLLSCLSKAMAVVFPLTLLLINFWMVEPGKDKENPGPLKGISVKSLLPLVPFFIVSLVFGILAISINKVNSFSFWHRIQFASWGFLAYVLKFIFPVNQVALYPYPTQTAFESGSIGSMLKLAPFIFLAVAVLIIYSFRKTKLLVFGAGFFFVTVMMVLQFISVGISMIADRYTYLSYIGLAFIPAMLIGETSSRKRVPLYILTACFVVLLIILSGKQTEVWRNSETLWTNVINRYPAEETPRSLRGIYYFKQSEIVGDIKNKKILEKKAFDDFSIAIKAGTKRADVFESTGCIYGRNGDPANAIQCFDKAIDINPGKGSAYYNRALALSGLNRITEALRDYNLALVYQPQNAYRIIANRYTLYFDTGKIREAIQDLDYLIEMDSKNVILYYNRALARAQLNNIQGAVDDCKKALGIQPSDQQTRELLDKLMKQK